MKHAFKGWFSNIVEIRVGEKVLWIYVLCCLNNENYCSNNVTKQTLRAHLITNFKHQCLVFKH